MPSYVYSNGYKYCGHCGNWVEGNQDRCPYCHMLLRCKPHRSKYVPQDKYVDPKKYL